MQRTCVDCKKTFPYGRDHYYAIKRLIGPTNPLGLLYHCKSCQKIRAKKVRDPLKESIRSKSWRERNPEAYKAGKRKWDKENAARKRFLANRGNRRLKWQVLCEYSGSTTPSCACCGETHFEFLSLDHIQGGGANHHKGLNKVGKRLYLELRKAGFPDKDKYRVLCMNCNFSIGRYGYCPHHTKATTPEDFGVVTNRVPRLRLVDNHAQQIQAG